jgi:hypothetical protein
MVNINHCMRFEILKVVTAKITAFWEVVSCSLVDMYRSSVEVAAYPEDGGSRFLH